MRRSGGFFCFAEFSPQDFAALIGLSLWVGLSGPLGLMSYKVDYVEYGVLGGGALNFLSSSL